MNKHKNILGSRMSQVTKEHRTILIALALVSLVVMVTLYLYNLERRHQEDVSNVDQNRLDVESSALEARSSGDLTIKLYFYQPGVMAPHPDLLTVEERSIFRTEDIILTARQIIHEVLTGPSTKEGFQVFSERATLRQIYLLEDGTALVDLSQEIIYPAVGGVAAELSALYSMTRSLIENIQEIRQIRFLVEGREHSTLAGHVSIREPFM
ncbi:MAG: GerMN domain-containing protein [Deltaproteobacteria bacterium]|nr:GerMN domain-containing protein [Deltaproteobacteria bacterium]MCZ6768715.1 GerMN domain-containing protein [Acidobacteriota bacterium]MCZ6876538.1 GerMN domain-containing protein [Acidobacteriota bacterium]